MSKNKNLKPEEMDALIFIENEHFDGDDVPENEMWSTDHVVNLMSNFVHKSEKDALLKEANELLGSVYTDLCNTKLNGVVSRKVILRLFSHFNQATESEAGTK